MGSTAPDEGVFSLLVTEADPAILDEAAGSLADAFHLDPAVALQVVKSAPIVFVRGLSKQEVKSLSPKLTELSKMGIEFRITARPTGKMPKLNWPVRPQFTAGGSGGPALTPSFDWKDSAFICPSCGEAFLFKRMGSLGLGEAPPEEPSAEVPGSGNSGSASLSKEAEEASTFPPSSDPDDQFSVFLPKITDLGRVDKAAELIAKYKGIPLPVARSLTARLVIPIAKGITRTDAQQILEEFKRHRIFGRMSKEK
jgi:hypothetical protein